MNEHEILELHEAGKLTGRLWSYKDITNEVYHNCIGLSSSNLKQISETPAHYMYSHVNPKPPSDAMKKGTLFHSKVLTPELFEEDWELLKPKTPKAQDKWTNDLGGMFNAVRNHPMIGNLLIKGSENMEQSLFWVDKKTGLLCKCRFDCRVEKHVFDFKKVADITSEALERAIYNFGYHLSARHYLNGYEALTGEWGTFTFIFVEDHAPFNIRVMKLGEDSLFIADVDTNAALVRFKQCFDSGEWPGYPETTELIDLPEWYLRRKENELK